MNNVKYLGLFLAYSKRKESEKGKEEERERILLYG